jgi:hypothetical protein
LRPSIRCRDGSGGKVNSLNPYRVADSKIRGTGDN